MASPTLPPTARRLGRARREGDHPISLAVTRLAGALCAAALLPLSAASLASETRELLASALRPEAAATLDGFGARLIWGVLPLLGAVAALAVALGVWQTHGTLSTKPLGWSWQRLNPFVAGARRAALPRLWAAASVVLGTGSFAVLASWLLGGAGVELAASIGDLERTLSLAADVGQRLLWWAVVIGLALAPVDALVQRRAWLERHRMTHEERVREEREAEGDPGLRHDRRELHRALLDSTQLSRMPGATLLVSSWPQLAVALRYDPDRDPAPVVLLHAVGPAASRARSAAELYQVALHDDPDLARSLARLPVDAPIPSSLFAAVAAALESLARAGALQSRERARSSGASRRLTTRDGDLHRG